MSTGHFTLRCRDVPGPVVLALPEDMLSEQADVRFLAPTAQPLCRAYDDDAWLLLEKLAHAKRPLTVAGGVGWSDESCAMLRGSANRQDLPVVTPFRRQDLMDNRSRNCIGDLGVGMNPGLARRLRNSDCLLVLGARLGNIMTGGYKLVDPAAPDKSILHVHPDPDLPGSVYRTDLCVTARAPEMVARLVRSPKSGDWTVWVESVREEYEAWSQPRETPGSVKLEQVVRWLSDTIP